MTLEGELYLFLALEGIEEHTTQLHPARMYGPERAVVPLRVRREQVDPGVAVERRPGASEILQQVGGSGVIQAAHAGRSDRRSSSSSAMR